VAPAGDRKRQISGGKWLAVRKALSLGHPPHKSSLRYVQLVVDGFYVRSAVAADKKTHRVAPGHDYTQNTKCKTLRKQLLKNKTFTLENMFFFLLFIAFNAAATSHFIITGSSDSHSDVLFTFLSNS